MRLPSNTVPKWNHTKYVETGKEVLIIKTMVRDIKQNDSGSSHQQSSISHVGGIIWFCCERKGSRLLNLLSVCESIDIYGFTVDPVFKEWRVGAGTGDLPGAWSIIKTHIKGNASKIEGLREAAVGHQG